jgi:hypothetical protein
MLMGGRYKGTNHPAHSAADFLAVESEQALCFSFPFSNFRLLESPRVFLFSSGFCA